jgi:hypothetical protein
MHVPGSCIIYGHMYNRLNFRKLSPKLGRGGGRRFSVVDPDTTSSISFGIELHHAYWQLSLASFLSVQLYCYCQRHRDVAIYIKLAALTLEQGTEINNIVLYSHGYYSSRSHRKFVCTLVIINFFHPSRPNCHLDFRCGLHKTK